MSAKLTEERVTVPSILLRKQSGRKIVALTAYDATFARLIDAAGCDVILVGDSLGCVIQGGSTTLPVTLDEMVYHCRCVTRGTTRALVVGDLPFMSYQASIEDGMRAAGRLVKEGGVAAVKLEGGAAVAPLIERLSSFDIPVMGHVGLTPQSFHRMGGHKVQGRSKARAGAITPGSREQVIADAKAVANAGAFCVVLEGVPAELAAEITAALEIPTIGIGAGAGCDGQILVSYDMLGLGGGEYPKFVKLYDELGQRVTAAVRSYATEVRSGAFPAQEHSFSVTARKKVALVK
ncbi:MAG: 3-methyl-2-oxobutanoate hydroxymethyltransferase [Proteobacteria bacterium]|nr:3-methyl-2-oxobutanoate hydroxymethyltransferase [Pseudomonadota bacterium]